MSLLAVLFLAILYTCCAFIAYRGVRTTLQRPLLGALALVCMVVMGLAAWHNLTLLNLGMQAYAMGVTDDLVIPVDLWQVGAFVAVAKYAPLWLLGKA